MDKISPSMSQRKQCREQYKSSKEGAQRLAAWYAGVYTILWFAPWDLTRLPSVLGLSGLVDPEDTLLISCQAGSISAWIVGVEADVDAFLIPPPSRSLAHPSLGPSRCSGGKLPSCGSCVTPPTSPALQQGFRFALCSPGHLVFLHLLCPHGSFVGEHWFLLGFWN